MSMRMMSSVKKVVLIIVVFCVMLASVLSSYVYLLQHRDQAVIKEFATAQLGLSLEKAESFIATCSVESVAGNCSALRVSSRESECARILSKLRGSQSNCVKTFVNFKGHVLSVQMTAYSDKIGTYVEVAILEQHFLLNTIY